MRLNHLIAPLKERTDDETMPIRTAVSLSYLRRSEQEAVNRLFDKYSISMKTAETLRKASAQGELSRKDIEKILRDAADAANVKPIKLSGLFLAKHFSREQPSSEIESVIAQALDAWFAK